jgi:hypothetical protein
MFRNTVNRESNKQSHSLPIPCSVFPQSKEKK